MELWILALLAFLITVVLVLWRPLGVHEAIPALIGAFVMFLVGLVDRQDVLRVMMVVWNSAMTIISTFVMATVLDGTGFFRWAAERLLERAQGSGRRLFHLTLAFSACLTVFLNNDGSILLGTPIIIRLVQQLRLGRRAAFGYLIGACLMASAVSPPIGVSNMANLEAMSLVGISLSEHLRMVLIPALVGMAACWLLVYAVFAKDLPDDLSAVSAASLPPVDGPTPGPGSRPGPGGKPHPPRHRLHHPVPLHDPKHRPGYHPPPPPRHRPPKHPEESRELRAANARPDYPFMWFAVTVVVLVRIGFFVASAYHVPPYIVAVSGAVVLLVANWHRRVTNTADALRRAPWAILGFAFGMDLVVFGLRKAEIIAYLAGMLGPMVEASPAGAAMLPGLLTTGVSALLNNHPGLIIGSLVVLEMGLGASVLRLVAYASVVLGSDLGALLTPVGTLASLIWFHLLAQNGVRYTWGDYVKVSLAVIPVSFLLALLSLWRVALLLSQ